MSALMRFVVLCSLLGVSCAGSGQDPKAPSSIRYAGGDGSACASAIQVLGAPDEGAGVKAEHAWLAQHHAGYSLDKQALVDCAGRQADRMSITTADGSKRDVYFDISDFFGKF